MKLTEVVSVFERWFGGFGSWAALPLRLALGIIFIAYGWDKFYVKGLGDVSTFFAQQAHLPMSELLAFLVAFVELFGGICVLLGIFTRYAAVGLAVIMVGAMFTVTFANGLLHGYDFNLALLAGALALLLTGPGPLSLERAVLNREL